MASEQRLYPFLYVDDVRAYMTFLDQAFGFAERLCHVDADDPEHVHAEMALGAAGVMIGHATPKFGTASPRTVPAALAGVYAYVEDVDAHYRRGAGPRRARAHGGGEKTTGGARAHGAWGV